MKIYNSMPSSMSPLKKAAFALMLLISFGMQACTRPSNWQQSSRDSADLAPKPDEFEDAVVLAYRAKVWGFRGLVADHTWIATKAKNADSYTVYEVIGWRLRRGNPALRVAKDIPDRNWFGSPPIAMIDIRGEKAELLVDKVAKAAQSYPYADRYKSFPGPNSNTFTAWVASEVPELGLDLPLRAIGRSYSFNN